jgi:hypothetical protein
MSTAPRESRIAVMMLAEVSWEDATGKLLSAPARLEDRSLSGACIRMKKSVEVGTKVKVHGRFEEFSGVVKYCRSEDWDYVVGVQRETGSTLTEKQAVVRDQPGLMDERAGKARAVRPAAEVQSAKGVRSGRLGASTRGWSTKWMAKMGRRFRVIAEIMFQRRTILGPTGGPDFGQCIRQE